MIQLIESTLLYTKFGVIFTGNIIYHGEQRTIYLQVKLIYNITHYYNIYSGYVLMYCKNIYKKPFHSKIVKT